MATLEEKWKNDPRPFEPIKNESLTCRTCANKTEQVSGCSKFSVKPIQVLKGGVCGEYKKARR